MRRLKAIQQVLTSHTPDTIPLALECWGSFPLGLMSLGKGSWLFTRRFCPTWCVDNAVLEEGQWGNGNYCWGWLIWAFKGWLIWAGWLIFCANTQAYLEQWQLSVATIVCIWKLIASSLMGLFGSLSDKKPLKLKKKKAFWQIWGTAKCSYHSLLWFQIWTHFSLMVLSLRGHCLVLKTRVDKKKKKQQ